MPSTSAQTGYTGMQIILHWTIAALVVLQLLLGEDIKPAYLAFSRNTEPAAADLFNANLHVYVGLAVLLPAIWRFGIRLQRGVPAVPPEESVVLKRIAAAPHFVLYLTIFGMPRARQAGRDHRRRPPCGCRPVAALLPEIGCSRQDAETGCAAYAVNVAEMKGLQTS